MYDSIEMALIEAKVMTVLEKPVWQDNYGNYVELESEVYCCKVTSESIQPNMVLLGN